MKREKQKHNKNRKERKKERKKEKEGLNLFFLKTIISGPSVCSKILALTETYSFETKGLPKIV